MKSFKDLKKNIRNKDSSLPVIKAALLGDTATQMLATGLRGAGIEYGHDIDLWEADYNQVECQFLDKGSDLYRFNADYVIVFQSTHKLGERFSLIPPRERGMLANERLDFVSAICKATGTKIIYFNYPETDNAVFGSYANKVKSSFTYQVRKLNCGLMDLCQETPNLFICDIAGVQNKIGRDVMFPANFYTNTEMVLSTKAIPYIAYRVLDIIAAVQGKFKKCLITDLDNTLWGGVIGDDGIEGIQLGHSLGIGKAFTELQMWIKMLKERGIILCVCSKNDEETARLPFEKHPDMILKLDDIAVFMANWETKVDNIRAIRQILNIGFDSMVFLDDNPFERNIVRENIPGITVPELPEDPSNYLEFLYNENLFETATFSNADNDRTKQYQVEAQRVSLAKTFMNEADFLKSLDMRSTVEGFNKFNTPRVAQLSQRSNQFNLRTVRYTEADIEVYAADPDIVDLSFTLKDKFGDNGLICVIIMKKQNENDVRFVDTWFMSCRVLKRGMEHFVLNVMIEKAKESGCKKIIGEYIPTTKNKMVKNHYPDLGFTPVRSNGSAQYELIINDYKPLKCYIQAN